MARGPGAGRDDGELRAVLPGGGAGGAGRDAGGRRGGAVRPAPRARWWAPGAALGPDGRADRLPWRQGRAGTAAGARARGQGGGAAELGTGGGRGLARALGDELDADRGDHAPLRPRGPPARGRRAGGAGRGGGGGGGPPAPPCG